MSSDDRVRRVRDAVAALPVGRRAVFDATAVATWVLAVAAALHDAALPAWLYYGAVLAGVTAYSLLTMRVEALAARSRRDRDANQ